MARAHLVKKNGAPVDHLTVHGTEWAYCPFDVRADGHDWKPTGGVTMGKLEIVVKGMRERARSATRERESPSGARPSAGARRIPEDQPS